MGALRLKADEDEQHDQILCFGEVSWADYLALLRMRGEHSAPRITYLEGRVEIMSPSRFHEGMKSIVGCLLEAYCLECDIDFSPYGAWTLKDRAKKSGAEPDECYVFGDVANPKRPDLVIEVDWTSGGIEKLEGYRRLGVREVWRWRSGEFLPYLLHGEHYRQSDRSRALPGIDLPQLVSFLDRRPVSRAIRAYVRALRRG